MLTILIIGAGKSTASLVKYLLDKSNTEKLQIRLADKNKSAALKLIDGHPNGDALEFDVFDANQRANEIQKADIVVSMLPARFHVEVAKDCLRFGKNMVTASYVSDEMQALHEAVEAKGLLFLNEMGLTEAGLNRLIRAGYDLLNLQTYFTVGPKEARAWTVKQGTSAPQAAGVIHGDFERGFIRAETIAYADFVSLNGEQGAKEAGKMRVEGKNYIVKDGDILHFLFNA